MAINYGDMISGASRSDNINQNGLVIDMEKFTKLLDENAYFLEALTRKVGKRITANRMKHEYRERRLIRNYCTVTTAAAVGATSFVTNEYNRVYVNFYVYNPRTTDLMLVTAAPTTTTVTMVDAVAGTGGTSYAWVANDILIILGESHAEGEEVPVAFSVDSINKYDYLMQKDRRIQATDIEEAEEHYDKDEKRAMDRKQAMISYRRDMNMLFYVGKNGREVTSASGPRRHCCGGLIEKISENVVDFSSQGSAFTLPALEGIMALTKYHSQSSESKFGLFGTRAWSAMSNWGRNALLISTDHKEWGLRINKIITGYGDIDVAYDPVLNETNGLQGHAFIIDTMHVRQLQMKGLPVRVILDIPNLSTVHQTVDAITGTFGLQLLFPELHARATGIQ